MEFTVDSLTCTNLYQHHGVHFVSFRMPSLLTTPTSEAGDLIESQFSGLIFKFDERVYFHVDVNFIIGMQLRYSYGATKFLSRIDT